MNAEQADIERLIGLVFSIMGRRGGHAKSPKKTKAVRENGKKGGRPKKPKAGAAS